MTKTWFRAHPGLIDALRWITFIAFVICTCAWYAQDSTPFQSQIGPWREVAKVEDLGGDLSESGISWLRDFAEKRAAPSEPRPEQTPSISPLGDRVRKARDHAPNGETAVCDLMFRRAGGFNRELRLLRLRDGPDTDEVTYQWRWSEDGKKLMVFGLGESEEPALIVYDIQQNEMVRIRPEHRWQDWEKQ